VSTAKQRSTAFWLDPVLWGIVAGAFVLRVVYNLALNSHNDPALFLVSDEREYFAAAHMFAEGRGLSFYDTFVWVRPPLYPLVLGSIFRMFGTGYMPTLLLQSLLSAATLLPLAWLAHWAAGRAGARWTAALGALYLPFTLFAGLLLSETLFIFLFALSLVWLLRAYQTLEDGWRKWLVWVALAGATLGLAALTRASAFVFVPLAALWLFFSQQRSTKGTEEPKSWQSRLAAPGALLAACLLVILPWMVRNVGAYGGFFLDTTGGYNLWLASVGVRDEPRLQADLKAIPNHAERQQFAQGKALENIVADPVAFLGKSLKESLDLWKPHFSSEERQVAGYAWGRVPGWHLAALFVFDDLLYLAILLLAIWGLAASASHPMKWLTGLWVLLWVIMAFVFFAVERFRLPIVAALLPWAGIGAVILTSGRLGKTVREMAAEVRLAAAAGALAAIVLVFTNIEWGQIGLGMQRWGEQDAYRQGESLLREGKVDEAIAAYERANTTVPDTRYALAAAYLRKGMEEKALSYLLETEVEGRYEPAIVRGEAARRRGDFEAARSFFNARDVQVAGNEALEWAWHHLNPPPTAQIDVGSGFDIGYIRGFHGPETDAGGTYRWSGPQAEFRNFEPEVRSVIEWSGWRPGRVPSARVTFTGSGPGARPVTEVVSASHEPVEKVLGITVNGGRFATNAFVGSGADPRLLGVRVFDITGLGASFSR
jgi:4-amino-4-deoxy-L-arabinose transferase-like glycosyltransferase